MFGLKIATVSDSRLRVGEDTSSRLLIGYLKYSNGPSIIKSLGDYS